ncbi:MAG: ribosome maturation factor RimP [bacterium]|nr:ribosome maturation factor RimP [bacterium]
MGDRTAGPTAVETRVRSLAAPLLAPLGVELDDVQWGGGRLRVVVEAGGGIDSETLVAASRALSAALDDADPIPSRYTLEVTSPGIERPLRRPEHYRRAVGSRVAVKRYPGASGERRLEGRLVAVDEERITLESDDGERQEIRLDTVNRARTVFDWGRSDARRNGGRPAAEAPPKGGSAE